MKRVHIIADYRDRLRVENFSEKLKNTGLETVADIISSKDSLANFGSASTLILWISSNADEVIYDIAKNLKESGHSVVNYFAEPTELSSEQRSIIGRNKTVFASLCQGNDAEEICALIKVAEDLSDPIEKVVTTGFKNDKDNAVACRSAMSNDESIAHLHKQDENKQLETKIPSNPIEESTSMSTDEKTDKEYLGISPWSGLIFMVVILLVAYKLEDFFDFTSSSIWFYVFYGIGCLLEASCISCVKEYREKNGKSFLSSVVLTIGYLLCLLFASAIFIGLWHWLF